MTPLIQAFEHGKLAAFVRFKLGFPSPTNATVQSSHVLSGAAPSPGLSTGAQQALAPPTDSATVRKVFDVQEIGKTRLEPTKKLGADVCTTCRKAKHYGPCLKPDRTRPAGEPHKAADFNPGLSGSDPLFVGDGDGPSTSPHYHSATSADSALARARDGRPADEQAASGLADLYRHLGVTSTADEPGQMTGGLLKHSGSLLGTRTHSLYEKRGPTVDITQEARPQGKNTPGTGGVEGDQQIDRAFRQVDNAVDSTCIEGISTPDGGPAVLG